MRKTKYSIIAACLLLMCQPDTLAEYELLDVKQAKMGILFLTDEIKIGKKNILGMEKEINEKNESVQNLIRNANNLGAWRH
jgi:hypothetical protein